jgi:hypothetical protein
MERPVLLAIVGISVLGSACGTTIEASGVNDDVNASAEFTSEAAGPEPLGERIGEAQQASTTGDVCVAVCARRFPQ